METFKNVWVDGCFDLIHYGHINLIRNAKKLGGKVIVGVHSDSDIAVNKRKPIMQIQEKKYILESLKDVEEVVINAPYITCPTIMDKYCCKLCVHGSDEIVTKDGSDPYYFVRSLHRFQQLPRTETISSTDLVFRMLFPNKIQENYAKNILKNPQTVSTLDNSDLIPKRTPENKVVYIGGRFELLHPSLIRYFKKIKGQNNYLIVGVFSDREIMESSGQTAILNSFERAISLNACKYVDRVLVNSPMKITKHFVGSLSISKIYYGDNDYGECSRFLNYGQIDPSLIVSDAPPREISIDYLYDRVRNNSFYFNKYFNIPN